MNPPPLLSKINTLAGNAFADSQPHSALGGNPMPQFHIKVDNYGGDLEPLADSLCELARRLDMAVTTVVGKDINVMDVLMRAHPRSTREEVLAEIQGRISRRLP
jgi:hypothetical protein